MKTKSKFIDLARLTNAKTSEALVMLRELEGNPKANCLSEVCWPKRFISASEPKERAVRRND